MKLRIVLSCLAILALCSCGDTMTTAPEPVASSESNLMDSASLMVTPTKQEAYVEYLLNIDPCGAWFSWTSQAEAQARHDARPSGPDAIQVTNGFSTCSDIVLLCSTVMAQQHRYCVVYYVHASTLDSTDTSGDTANGIGTSPTGPFSPIGEYDDSAGR